MARDFIFRVKKGEANPPVDPTGTRIIFDEDRKDMAFLERDGKIRRNKKEISIPLIFSITEDDVKKNFKLLEIPFSVHKMYDTSSFIITDLIANPFDKVSRELARQVYIDSFYFDGVKGALSIKLLFSFQIGVNLDLILKAMV